ncbi:MAG: chorismate mutase [Bacteroidota bacterium]
MKTPIECNSLDELRDHIDAIDHEILQLLSDRFEYVKEVVKYKKPDKESIIAKERKDAVIKRRRELALEYGLDPDTIEKVYRTLIDYFIEEELRMIKSQNGENH